MHRRSLTLAATVLALGAALAGAAPQPAAPAAVRAIQDRRVSVRFQETPLADAFVTLSDVAGVRFVLHPEVAAKIPEHLHRVDLELKDVPFRTVLRFLLEPRDLALEDAGGPVLVLPRAVQDEEVTLVMYDVRDLMHRIVDFPAPEMTLPDYRDGFIGLG